jgi:hypothetical protein
MRANFCFSLLLIALFLSATVAQQTPSSQNPRVFITDSQSWEMSGSSGGSSSGFGGTTHGGARPQTAEIIKTFGERCSQVVVNNKQDRADYIVLLDHEGGKGLAKRDNKVAVFNKDGDSILSHSTRSLGNAVKDACEAISKDWPARAANSAAASQGAQLVNVSEQTQESSAGKISVSSTPANADIEMDGSFVGNTPSMVEVGPGQHSIVIKKAGYKTWQRNMKITSGAINVTAELEKAQ